MLAASFGKLAADDALPFRERDANSQSSVGIYNACRLAANAASYAHAKNPPGKAGRGKFTPTRGEE
ncbi:MAG: hypothetical protein HYS06_11350 [Methylocystis sp.]|nr:hypothetical protein [Methylocystis sp.]